MPNAFFRLLTLAAFSITLAACGSTSSLKHTGSAPAPKAETTPGESIASNPGTKQQEEAPLPKFAGYNKVLVQNFDTSRIGNNIYAGQMFADKIASRIAYTGVYDKVLREAPESLEGVLIVTGEITRYDEGNPTMRLLIGMGAGSSYFDARVDVLDAKTKKVIGIINVDRNSWVLGGGIAMSQDVASHMDAAAERIAEEMDSAKTGKKLASADE